MAELRLDRTRWCGLIACIALSLVSPAPSRGEERKSVEGTVTAVHGEGFVLESRRGVETSRYELRWSAGDGGMVKLAPGQRVTVEFDLQTGQVFGVRAAGQQAGVRNITGDPDSGPAPTSGVVPDDGPPRLVALCVGVQKYQHVPALRFSGTDALYVERAIRGTLTGRTADIHVLSDSGPAAEQVDLRTVRAKLASVLHSVRPADTLLFTFAGHGFQDADGEWTG